MKAIKYTLYGAGVLVLLAALALGAAVAIVDGAFVKSRLERMMKEKNRTLAIEGVPALKLFPVAGITLGKTSLSEPGSSQTFVALESLDVAVRVMPLLSGEIAIQTLKLSGLTANVIRRKDGRMNFDDLAGEARETREAQGPPPLLRIAEMDAQRVQINYRDEATGRELALSDFSLKAGQLDGASPGPVSLSARLTGKRPEVDLAAQAGGALRFDLARSEIGLEGFSAKLKGRADRDAVNAELSAPKLEITPARAGGEAITGFVQVKGPQRSVDAKLRIAAVQGTAADLSIPGLALELDARAAGQAVKAKLEGALKADLRNERLQADLAGKLDDSTIKAKLAATKLAPLAASFELSADRLDLDRYAPPKKEAGKPGEPIDLSGLKGPTVNGKLRIGALTARRVKLSDVKAELKLAGGRLEVAPHSAALYGGTTSGSLTADANGNRVTLKETAKGVNVGPLLRDAAGQDRLEGRANVNLDVATAGASAAAMKKALGGKANVELRDGAVRGFDLAASFRDVKSVLGSKSAKGEDRSKKTDFSEITASFDIKGGVARNDDLQGKSPFLRLTGAGNLDIGNNAIDYLAKATLVATSRGQGGADTSSLAGVTVPVKLTGALDKPDWSIDYAELAAKSGVGKVVGKIGEAAGSAAGSVRDKVRGLFGR